VDGAANRLAVAGFVLSAAGGAPAGVVDPVALNKDLAGVAWAPPNKVLPLLLPPKRVEPPVGALEVLPNSEGAEVVVGGLLAAGAEVVAVLPKRLGVAVGVVEEVVAAFPNRLPL